MTLKYYIKDNESTIFECEDSICDTYLQTVNLFNDVFMRYGCTIEAGRFWYNSITGMVSTDRIPFINGYLSGLSCQLLHEGKLVEFGDEEIALSSCWLFSSVRKITLFPCFWNSHLEVVLSTDTSDVKEELEEWVKLLQKNISSLQDLN